MSKSSSYKELLTQKDFLKITAANIVNRFGDSIDTIALSWVMFELTGSASLMAFIFGINFIPTIVLQPIFAVFVERISKKKVMVLTDIGRGLLMSAMAILFLLGKLSPLIIGTVTVLNSTLEAFRVPAGTAILPKLLPVEQYTTGSALGSTTSRIAEVVGFAVAGIIMATLGAAGALLIDMATFFISALFISLIKIEEERQSAISSVKDLKTDFLDGVLYIFKSKLLIAIFSLGLVLNFCIVPINAMGVAYVSEYLGQKAEFMSYIQICLVLGVAVGSSVTPKLNKIKNVTLLTISGVVISMTLVSLLPLTYVTIQILKLILVLLTLTLLGVGIGVQTVIYITCFMEKIDKTFLSRITGLINSFLCAAVPIASFLCSLGAYLLPVPVIICIFGVTLLVFYLTISRLKIYKQL